MVGLCARSFSVPPRVEEAIIQSWRAATALTAGFLPEDQPVPRERTKRKMKIGFRFLLCGAASSESINHVTGAAIKTELQISFIGRRRPPTLKCFTKPGREQYRRSFVSLRSLKTIVWSAVAGDSFALSEIIEEGTRLEAIITVRQGIVIGFWQNEAIDLVAPEWQR
jgi:hypothetical protein